MSYLIGSIQVENKYYHYIRPGTLARILNLIKIFPVFEQLCDLNIPPKHNNMIEIK